MLILIVNENDLEYELARDLMLKILISYVDSLDEDEEDFIIRFNDDTNHHYNELNIKNFKQIMELFKLSKKKNNTNKLCNQLAKIASEVYGTQNKNCIICNISNKFEHEPKLSNCFGDLLQKSNADHGRLVWINTNNQLELEIDSVLREFCNGFVINVNQIKSANKVFSLQSIFHNFYTLKPTAISILPYNYINTSIVNQNEFLENISIYCLKDNENSIKMKFNPKHEAAKEHTKKLIITKLKIIEKLTNREAIEYENVSHTSYIVKQNEYNNKNEMGLFQSKLFQENNCLKVEFVADVKLFDGVLTPISYGVSGLKIIKVYNEFEFDDYCTIINDIDHISSENYKLAIPFENSVCFDSYINDNNNVSVQDIFPAESIIIEQQKKKEANSPKIEKAAFENIQHRINSILIKLRSLVNNKLDFQSDQLLSLVDEANEIILKSYDSNSQLLKFLMNDLIIEDANSVMEEKSCKIQVLIRLKLEVMLPDTKDPISDADFKSIKSILTNLNFCMLQPEGFKSFITQDIFNHFYEQLPKTIDNFLVLFDLLEAEEDDDDIMSSQIQQNNKKRQRKVVVAEIPKFNTKKKKKPQSSSLKLGLVLSQDQKPLLNKFSMALAGKNMKLMKKSVLKKKRKPLPKKKYENVGPTPLRPTLGQDMYSSASYSAMRNRMNSATKRYHQKTPQYTNGNKVIASSSIKRTQQNGGAGRIVASSVESKKPILEIAETPDQNMQQQVQSLRIRKQKFPKKLFGNN